MLNNEHIRYVNRSTLKIL